MSLNVGDKAPDFKLFSSDKAEVSLENYKGKNLIIQFFPAAFTGVCTTQMCEMRDSLKKYEKLNAEVVGVSIDTPFSLAKFKEQEGLNFPLLSDFNKKMIQDYGVYRENFVLGMTGVSNRAAFLVDGEGTIRYAEVLDSPGNLPNFSAMNEALEGLN